MRKPRRPSLSRDFPRAVLAASALALVLAACGSAGAQPPPADSSAPVIGPVAGVTFHGTLYISGQVDNKPTTWHVTKTFTDRVPAVRTCADAAQSGMAAGIFRVPSPQAPLPEARIEVTGFRGPGTYPPQVMKHDKSDSILLGQNSGLQRGTYLITTSAHGTAQGKEVLFLNKDGSGQLVYSQAHLDGKAASPAVAGLISWSCSS
jgi:hypothetical protein